MSKSTCPNCSNEVVQNYCSNCGQELITIPISPKGLSHLLYELIDFNKPFFRTFYSLYLKPSIIVKEYLAGRTLPYINPFKYLLLMVTVIVLGYLIRLPDTNISEMSLLTSEYVTASIFYTYLFNFVFFRRKYSFSELVLVTTFQVSAFGFLLFLVSHFSLIEIPTVIQGTISAFVILFYFCWFFKSVFAQGWIVSLVKSILFLIVLISISLLIIDVS